MKESRQRGLPLLLKLVLDRATAVTALVLVSPVILLVAAAVRVKLGSPVLFAQVRPGFRGRPFRLLKFRTMRNALGPDGRSLPDAERLDPFGRWLRSTSLDELPQLWNVVRGDLSLVGPRPLLMSYLERYSEYHRQRHDVRAGITGWSQVNGRNALDWDTKLDLDVWYAQNWSLGLDLRILAMTVGRVLGRTGVSQAGSATMPEFTGSRRAEPPKNEGGVRA